MKNKLVKATKLFLLYPGFCLLLCALPFFNPLLKVFFLSLSFTSGESMIPTIKDGDLIVSRPYMAGKDELKKGMVVGFWDTYEKNEIISVQHRIIEISKEGIETQGDNNETPDEGFKKSSQVHSICRFIVPSHYLWGMGEVKSAMLFLTVRFFLAERMKEKALGTPAYAYLIFFLLMELFFLAIKRKSQGKRKVT